MSVNLAGILRNYKNRSLKGFFADDDGNYLNDKEARDYIDHCLMKGWKIIPMCDEEDCPDFDHSGKGCPGHEITKEQFEERNG